MRAIFTGVTLVLAIGLLASSSALAAPARALAIGDAASFGSVTEQAHWRHWRYHHRRHHHHYYRRWW
ncbi:MAG: hypothetical protein ABWZ64_17520 [Xanthobacteraceae bacterium]|jgi:hypothetical protein